VKLLLSLLWTEGFRNNRNCGKPWSTRKGHSFLQWFSGVQKSTHYLMELNTDSQYDLRLCLKVTSRLQHTFLKSMNSKLNKKNHTHTHKHTHRYTHTKCWYTVGYLVSKFHNFHLWNYKVEQMSSNWTAGHHGALQQLPHPNEMFSSKDSYVYLNNGYTQRVWNSGYSKNFYKEQRN
jgi:hypothetical protein